ncbi:unnamed protein product [Phyllotreta striolata]|uniref:Glycoside hydrolase family 1 n=1 Tax=Phyllotreta striolata TaxID=444603 RepID=A0A9N9TZM0_PHYSR|nr:unnamed protein product [Phyllotreta striolata]
MKRLPIFIALIALSLADDINPRKFPKTFKLGVANAAPQIEGGWNEDGKGETIWDRFAHKHPEKIADRSTPDVACDSYHKYKEDIALIKAMGLDHYRLSIAWSRVLPTGYTDKVNKAGVEYYKNVFKELKENDIKPMVTLYHWDLPQPLQDQMNGWLNESIVDVFGDYAKFAFETFGDDVDWWITVNEPKQVCQSGYGTGGYAPGVVGSGVTDYSCARNILLAHARAWHIYNELYRSKNKGKVAIVVDASWSEPGSDSDADRAAAERATQFEVGLYANPVFNGDWPEVVKRRVAERSKMEGYEESRLPAFSEREIAYLKGTSDYLALNTYSTMMVSAAGEAPLTASFEHDKNVRYWAEPDWPKDGPWWFYDLPWGLRKFLNWLKRTYNNPEIVVTENGYVTGDDTLEDDKRIHYFRGYLSACLDAIYKDNVNLTAYTAWSIMDDWEWTGGYTSFLGLYKVNFTDPERPRIKRKSADFFAGVAKNRCLLDPSECID